MGLPEINDIRRKTRCLRYILISLCPSNGWKVKEIYEGCNMQYMFSPCWHTHIGNCEIIWESVLYLARSLFTLIASLNTHTVARDASFNSCHFYCLYQNTKCRIVLILKQELGGNVLCCQDLSWCLPLSNFIKFITSNILYIPFTPTSL